MSALMQSRPTSEQALMLWRAGQHQEAQRICESLVAAGDTAALSLLAEIYVAAGEKAQAIQALERLARERPSDPSVQRRLGNAYLAADSCEAAVASYRTAIALEPLNVRAYNNLAQALTRLERDAEAAEVCEQALALDPNSAIAHNNLGTVLQRQGLSERALESYRRAVALEPTRAEPHCNCGELLLYLNRSREALAHYDAALAHRPDLITALMGRGNTLQRLRRFAEALADYRRVLELEPRNVSALSKAANVLRKLQRQSEALTYCERGLQLEPENLETLCTRGLLLGELGQDVLARESFERAVSLGPQNCTGRMLLLMSQISPIPRSSGEVQASRAAFARELERFLEWLPQWPEADDTPVGAAQPFFLAYQEVSNRELLAAYGQICCEVMSRWHVRHCVPRQVGAVRGSRTVRVGIVSAQIRDHAVYRAFVKGWLRELAGESDLEVGIVHLGLAADAHTEWAKAHAAFYVSAGDKTLLECIAAIEAAQVDVLIYPEVGMDPMTLKLASLRLAPHQLTAWGHPETSGLRTLDYYLSAEAFEPESAQEHYTEKLVRLPGLGCYYEPFDLTPQDPDLAGLGLSTDRPVLLCPGSPFKYAPEHDRVLVEIARRLEGCQLVFFEPNVAFLANKLGERLRSAFHVAGVDPAEHIRWIPWQPQPQFFGLLQRATLCLDTIGFSGFNTAMQAIECDLPVVAYEGRFMRGRLASGILRALGQQDLIASDPDHFVDLVVTLARDGSRRQAARAHLQATRPVLFRDRTATAALAEFLRSLPVARGGG